MEEGTSKAIPLRRSRATSRTATRTDWRWTESLGNGAQLLLAPPRQVWLAGLGVGVLAVQAIRTTWIRAVAEGAAVEDWIRSSLVRSAPDAT